MATHWQCVVLTRRNPRLSLRLPGSFLLRFADRQLTALLFHPPPRMTRFEPLSPLPLDHRTIDQLASRDHRIGLTPVSKHARDRSGERLLIDQARLTHLFEMSDRTTNPCQLSTAEAQHSTKYLKPKESHPFAHRRNANSALLQRQPQPAFQKAASLYQKSTQLRLVITQNEP